MGDKKPSRTEFNGNGSARSRRAARLLSTIEAHCLHMRDESRRVVAAYLLESGEDFKRRFNVNYIQSLKLAESARTLLFDHLERFAAQWKHLVPADPELRAELLHLVLHKYGIGPATFAALGGSEPDVQSAYQELFGDSHASLGSRSRDFPVKAAKKALGAKPEAWEDVETQLEWLNLESGEILYSTGDPGDALYVVISGRLRATVTESDGCERMVGEMGRGEMLGELEVLTGDPRSVTVRAVRDSELVRLGRGHLLALSQQHLEVMAQINAMIARRLRQQYTQAGPVENTLLTFTLVPTSPGIPLQEFGRQLALAMGEFGPAMYVNSAVVDEAIEPGASQSTLGDPLNSQVVSWLSELETHYRYVIYEAAPDDSGWSRRCIRQADRIVLVGRAGDSSQPAGHEVSLLAGEELLQCGPGANRVHLVLLHEPAAGYPSGTAAWLAPRILRSHHHVRSGDARDMAYLARCLTGHALGLVLGGGAARGMAHIGVLRALEEAGLAVDIVGGSSMGAIISGAIGLGLDSRQITELVARFSSPRVLFDPTLPVVSLFASGKVTSMLQNICGDLLIEDLWRPMFCVSSNLSRSCEKVHRQGLLWKAIRASIAIPGIFAPVLHEGDLHVDGAVMNNLPIDVMREPGLAGTVVGVNVMPLQDMDKEYHFGDSISGVRAMLSLLNPYDTTSAPMIYETLVRVMSLHEVYQQAAKQRLTDIYITPPVEKFKILGFAEYNPIIEAGYREAQKAIAEWQGKTGKAVEISSSFSSYPSSLQQLDNTLSDLDNALENSGLID